MRSILLSAVNDTQLLYFCCCACRNTQSATVAPAPLRGLVNEVLLYRVTPSHLPTELRLLDAATNDDPGNARHLRLLNREGAVLAIMQT